MDGASRQIRHSYETEKMKELEDEERETNLEEMNLRVKTEHCGQGSLKR